MNSTLRLNAVHFEEVSFSISLVKNKFSHLFFAFQCLPEAWFRRHLENEGYSSQILVVSPKLRYVSEAQANLLR